MVMQLRDANDKMLNVSWRSPIEVARSLIQGGHSRHRGKARQRYDPAGGQSGFAGERRFAGGVRLGGFDDAAFRAGLGQV